jgi:hypothetical protein
MDKYIINDVFVSFVPDSRAKSFPHIRVIFRSPEIRPD